MRAIGNLVKRNFYMFFRDKMAVFFAFMSMLVVIALMALFLGDMNVDEILNLLKEYGGIRNTAEDTANAKRLVEVWTIAGILTVNTVTVSLSAMGIMVEDSVQNKAASFYAAPVRKITIVLGYLFSAISITVIMCVATLAIAQLYILANGGEFFGVSNIGKVIGLIALQSVLFSMLMYIIASFIKSASAWSALGTIIGTLVGFLGAIYLPMGSIPAKVGEALAYLPILHGTSLMRKVLTGDILLETFSGLNEKVPLEYQKAMGITIEMNKDVVSTPFQIGFLVICVIIMLGFIIWMEQKRKISDR